MSPKATSVANEVTFMPHRAACRWILSRVEPRQTPVSVDLRLWEPRGQDLLEDYALRYLVEWQVCTDCRIELHSNRNIDSGFGQLVDELRNRGRIQRCDSDQSVRLLHPVF